MARKKKQGKPTRNRGRDWLARYGELLKLGAAYIPPEEAFHEIDTDLHQRLLKDPDQEFDRIFSLLVSTNTQLMLRNLAALHAALKRHDRKTGATISADIPAEAKELISRLERQEQAFLKMYQLRGKIKHAIAMARRCGDE